MSVDAIVMHEYVDLLCGSGDLRTILKSTRSEGSRMTLLEDARSIADEPTRLHHPPQRCSAVATQIKVAHRLHNMRTIRYPAPTGQLRKAIHSALGAAARLLPITCRKRWIQEWDGELHAAETLTGRLRYTLDVLTGLPTMAIIPRARSQL